VLFICLALGSILMLPISLQQSLPASIEAGTIPKLLVFASSTTRSVTSSSTRP